jgi:tetratricopeptide (TPR) repeat protein
MARHLESEGDSDAALAAYNRAAALDPQSAAIPTAMAELYARENKVDECVAAAEKALAIDADAIPAHRILGLVYSSLSQSRGRRAAGRDYTKDAIAHLERAYAAGRPDTSVMLALGRLYLRAGAYEKAIAPLRQLVESEPGYNEGVAMLAQAYSSAGKADDATALLEDLSKDDPQYLTLLADQYERANQWDKAAQAYERAAEREPANAELKSQWALALLNSPAPPDAAKAQTLLQELVADKPTDNQAWYLLSQAQRKTSDFAGAEASARQIIKNDPDGVTGPYALAQVFESARDFRKVVDTLTPVVAPFTARADASPRPDIARLYLHLGFAHEQLKDYDKAIETLQQGRRYARDASIVFQLGSVLERQKRYTEAEKTFKDALQADPLNAPALNYLGYMLADRGERLEEAVGYIRRALEIEPGNSSYLDSLGWAYFKMNKLDLAQEPLKRASAELTTNSVVQDHYGDLLFKLGRFGDAVSAWERALAGDGESIDKAQIDRKIKSARAKSK